MMLHLLHDCRFYGVTVRHRDPIDYHEVEAASRHLHLEGIRCDGSPIAVNGHRVGGTLIAYNEYADDPHDPDRRERIMLNPDTGEQWVSRSFGPWEPITLPEVEVEPEQDALFDLEGESA